MFVMRRENEGWFWPKTVLDFAAWRGVTRGQLDRLMDVTSGLLLGRELSVSLRWGANDQGRERPFVAIEPAGSLAGLMKESQYGWLYDDWCAAVDVLIPDHFV